MKGGRKADLEILIEKKSQMVYPVIIFLKKAANNSSRVEFLFPEFVQSNFETPRIGGGQVFVIGNFI